MRLSLAHLPQRPLDRPISIILPSRCEESMKSFTLSFLLLSLAPLAVRAEDWPQWRGPDRSGVSKETGLLKSWDKAPKLIWEARGAGRGYAQAVVSKGKVFTLGDGLSTADDKDEYVTCSDDQTGKQLWKSKTGPAWNAGSPSWQSSRSTPTVDGDLLFVITPHGVLICLETSKGEQKWKKDLKSEFGGSKGQRDPWGFSESPLVDGDRVVCTPGDKTAMVALNKKTGEVIWKCEGNLGFAGHASIVVSEVGGTRVYVNITQNKVIGVKASDGKLLWSKGHRGATAVIPTVIVKGDLVYYAVGYGAGAGLLRQVAGGDGSVKVEEVYPQKNSMANKHGGVVLVGDHVYGGKDDDGFFWCAELLTGKEVWRERVSGRNSIAVSAADGNLYLKVADGTVLLVKASPEGFKQLGSFKVTGSAGRPSWSHPVIANGRLYLREGDRIACYDIKDSASGRR